ncbi:MAG: hypothetical protein A3D50_00730 [Candidatus Taylorbacteria bacterium RIFCSPHIGHO2_02_FULL_44_12]|uniref:Uncharacterized protein n=1 Tax=Candidatus Taylorbacteria bacterium RIFCSPHIGHO2_02_FULL_44_12 TaxID=1802308 RepID=A0A1G2MMI8_9BACT|nr:MAG: hypothetical protein A3D50_00730 [Candidatus Taylorbacteria bacterium RIFCSPHIGHO2_02_FULL_44_12]
MNNERLLRGSLEWRVNIKLGARITRRLTVLVVDTSKHHTAATMSLARSGHGCFAVTNLGAGIAAIRHGHFDVALVNPAIPYTPAAIFEIPRLGCDLVFVTDTGFSWECALGPCALEDHVVDGRKVIFCRSANKNRWAMAVSQLLGE